MKQLAVAAIVLLAMPAAGLAQTTSSGSIRGVVHDGAAQLVIGATVIATSPALQGSEGGISDEHGAYYIANLPPGRYTLTVDSLGSHAVRRGVIVQLGKEAAINLDLPPTEQTGEVIEIKGRAPTIDLGSAKTGITLTSDYTSNVPTGRTFTDAAEAAPGAQRDDYGISFAGSTSPENAYLVEGLNVTGVSFGDAGLTLPHEFLGETEVITGAYGAELGRSTGGILNVLTKAGGNEVHGSVFGTLTPGALTRAKRVLPNDGNVLSFQRELGNRGDLGAELGGPIVRDKLWFHVGLDPAFERQQVHRVISTQIDANGDGVPDTGADGFRQLEELSRRTITLPAETYFFTSKLSFALGPDHRGSLAAFGSPRRETQLVDDFAVGPDAALMFHRQAGAYDAVGRWTSEVADQAGELEAIVGFHHDEDENQPAFAAGHDPAVRFLYERPLGDFTGFDAVPAACVDGSPTDRYPGIVNCPVINYQVGGVDFVSSERRRRLAGRLAYRQIVELGGRHELKAGVDLEDETSHAVREFPGGNRWWDVGDATVRIRFLSPATTGTPCGADLGGDGTPDGTCAAQQRLRSDTGTLNTGAFVQDSWSPLPELTINAGLRWERQALGSARQVAGQVDPFTGAPIAGTPLVLDALFAPRVGAIYDWTREGRSRVFANWGRFYESIPLDLNSRGMSGEVIDIQYLDPASCGDPLRPRSYTCDPAGLLFGGQQGGNKLVAPHLQGQHSDELVAGVEYELADDLTIGATYVRRTLGAAIEDVSPDGATSVLANPGSVDRGAVRGLRDRAQAARTAGDTATADRLDYQATLFEGVGAFPKPVRRYDALELSGEKRFASGFMIRGSYTYSRLRGNFPGLYSPDTNQLDPNFTSMYDFAETLPNRYGDLPHDRPHQLKLDGYYQVDAGERVGTFVVGSRVRAASGRPHNYLGSDPLAGEGEIFILPRGSGKRAPWQSAVDLHLAYQRGLGKATALQVFVDVFNVLDQQSATRLDEIYTYDAVTPIRHGTKADLAHLTALGPDGQPTDQPVTVNPNFGKPIESQEPLSIRLGARLTF